MSLKRVTYLIKEQSRNAAAYNRVRMLVKGLNSNGIRTSVVFIPKYEESLVLYYCRYVLLLVRCFCMLLVSSKESVFILYGEDMILKYLLMFPRRGLLISERNEYSTYLYDNSLSPEHIASIKKFENCLKSVDGMIVCSESLNKYYHTFCEKPFCIIPLVYEEGFIKRSTQKDNQTIVYCGDMGGGKDGVDILIKSYSLLCQEISDYRLILIGGARDSQVIANLKRMTEDLGISDKVFFTGWVGRNELPSYLENASLLVLSRPANKQAEGGIPSKLAEYLSTGRPVLTTKVGDLPLYFKHCRDIFFAEPGSVEDFSDKMKEIICNYTSSCAIGSRGYYAVKQFEGKVQSQKIITYLNTLLG